MAPAHAVTSALGSPADTRLVRSDVTLAGSRAGKAAWYFMPATNTGHSTSPSMLPRNPREPFLHKVERNGGAREVGQIGIMRHELVGFRTMAGECDYNRVVRITGRQLSERGFDPAARRIPIRQKDCRAA